jgi:hypothetical protein
VIDPLFSKLNNLIAVSLPNWAICYTGLAEPAASGAASGDFNSQSVMDDSGIGDKRMFQVTELI